LNTRNIEKQGSEKRDEDRDEEDKEKSRVVRIPYKQLSSVQKNIIQYCSIPRTAKEIMDHVGYYNNTKNMSSLVKPLLELGFLEMTEPDKPNSKNQKYRKVRN
jgi:SOS-response transcriptional repressor LexA